MLASCFSFVLTVARYAFELTVNNLLNNLMKSVQDLMTDLGLRGNEEHSAQRFLVGKLSSRTGALIPHIHIRCRRAVALAVPCECFALAAIRLRRFAWAHHRVQTRGEVRA